MTRTPLGSWRFPSGNTVEASIVVDALPVYEMECVWDTLPPSEDDQRYYLNVVIPDLTQRAMKHFKLSGGAAVVLG